MKRRISRMSTVGFVVMCVVASVGLSAQAAEKKKLEGSFKSKRIISSTTVYLSDVPRHELAQGVRIDTALSPDPDFNEIEVLNYGQSDQVAGSGAHKGYRIMLHKNGEESYLKFEGTHKTSVKEGGAWEVSFEGTYEHTGGTGKFKNIKGSGTYTGKTTAAGVTGEYKGEVEY